MSNLAALPAVGSSAVPRRSTDHCITYQIGLAQRRYGNSPADPRNARMSEMLANALSTSGIPEVSLSGPGPGSRNGSCIHPKMTYMLI